MVIVTTKIDVRPIIKLSSVNRTNVYNEFYTRVIRALVIIRFNYTRLNNYGA